MDNGEKEVNQIKDANKKKRPRKEGALL